MYIMAKEYSTCLFVYICNIYLQIHIVYMPCWIKSAQVLYILSVLTNYSHEFAQEVLQQERSFAAQKILIDTLESAGFHLILFMLVQNISYHHPVIVFNTSPCALNNLLETRSYPFHFSFSSQPGRTFAAFSVRCC